MGLCFSVAATLEAQVTFESAFPNLRFNFPVELLPSVDGSDRLFLVEQRGVIYVFPNDSNVSENERQVFLDIEDVVGYQKGSELGLLGMAFHPDYFNNGFVYFYYTIGTTSVSQNRFASVRLERYQVDPNNPDRIDPNSSFVLLEEQKNVAWSNHNGGKITFGPDGYLYMSIGDAGGGGDPALNGQNLNTIFAKILRIDVDVDGSNPMASSGNYEIPSNNPLVGQNGRDEIYAWGIRNTWKMSFDPVTDQLWGAEVGQGKFEEINLIENGGNYGWNRYEAFRIEEGSTVAENPIDPLFFYDHTNDDKSITGGYVYRGNEIPELIGQYIYGDYISGRVWALTYDSTAQADSVSNELLFRADGTAIPTFGQDQNGELYFTSYTDDASIFKIVSGTSTPPGTQEPGVGYLRPFSEGADGVIRAMAKSPNGDIVIGGLFDQVSGISANNIAMWSPQTGWIALANGTNGEVMALAYDANGNLYIGGEFTEIASQAANYIARYDGNTFTALASGTNGPVAAITVSASGQVFAGGAFETAGGIAVSNIAQWDNGWQALTDQNNSIAGTNNEVRSLGIDQNGNLYVGGNFATAGGNFASTIARWDGNNWSSLGDGTSGFVQAIAIDENYLYAGGNFALAGTNTVNRIARWSFQNESWEGLGNGLSGVVNTISLDSIFIYVGGGFATASNDTLSAIQVNNLARWSETSNWEPLGDDQVGSNGPVNTIMYSPNSVADTLYVGGNFTLLGSRIASDLGFWTDSLLTSDPLSIGPLSFGAEQLILFPNPTRDQVFVDYEGITDTALEVLVWNRKGVLMQSFTVNVEKEQGQFGIDLSYLTEDTYIIQIKGRERASSFQVLRTGE